MPHFPPKLDGLFVASDRRRVNVTAKVCNEDFDSARAERNRLPMQRRQYVSERRDWAQVDDAGQGPVWLTKTIANHAALSGRRDLDA